MISLQRLLGQEDEFYGLLERSAQQGLKAIQALLTLTDPGTPAAQRNLSAFVEARRADKEITNALESKLITTFVTPIEREDLEALAEALYKIPKTVEKFAERYLIVQDRVKDVDFSRQINLMLEASELVLKMIQTLRARGELSELKSLQKELQRVEAHADDILLASMQPFYQPGFPALKAVILHDLFNLNEKVVDRCRDAGNVVSHVVLKNS